MRFTHKLTKYKQVIGQRFRSVIMMMALESQENETKLTWIAKKIVLKFSYGYTHQARRIFFLYFFYFFIYKNTKRFAHNNARILQQYWIRQNRVKSKRNRTMRKHERAFCKMHTNAQKKKKTVYTYNVAKWIKNNFLILIWMWCNGQNENCNVKKTTTSTVIYTKKKKKYK